MFYFLLLLGFVAMAAGVFVIGFGIPIRETSFGAALLMSGSIAITGGFILVGLAAAVRELKRVAQGLKMRFPGGPRPVRPAERRDTERAGSDRRPEPRLPMPGALGPEVPNVVPTKLDASDTPDTQELWSKPGPEWLRRAVVEIEATPRPPGATLEPDNYRTDAVRRVPDAWPRNAGAPPLDNAATEERRVPGVLSQSVFDTWSSEQDGSETAAEQGTEESLETQARPAEAKSPPMVPAPTPVAAAPTRPVRVEPRPLPVLKSGVIDNMAYTLFSDGSIEAQMPNGTMRFASIDALRKHLQRDEG